MPFFNTCLRLQRFRVENRTWLSASGHPRMTNNAKTLSQGHKHYPGPAFGYVLMHFSPSLFKLDGIWYGFAVLPLKAGEQVSQPLSTCGDNLSRARRGCVGTTCCAPAGGVWGQLVTRREGVCGDNLLRAGRGCVGTTEITE